MYLYKTTSSTYSRSLCTSVLLVRLVCLHKYKCCLTDFDWLSTGKKKNVLETERIIKTFHRRVGRARVSRGFVRFTSDVPESVRTAELCPHVLPRTCTSVPPGNGTTAAART